MKTIYLDYAATTPLDPLVLKAMLPYLKEKYGNPSSLHALGTEAKEAIDKSRSAIAKILNCSPKEIIFEASGTESINHALIGSALASQAKGRHIMTSAIEHHAVLHACGFLETQGFEVAYLPVNKQGLVDLKMLEQSIRPDTILVSIAYANNEIGAIQDIKKIASIIKKKNSETLFHADACQAAGYLELDIEALGVDLMSVNGSKIYGPKGTGFLYVKDGTALRPIMHGGEQESSRRAGTENVAGIVGLAAALKLAQVCRVSEAARLFKLQAQFIKGLLKIKGAFLNGPKTSRLPNNINVLFAGVSGGQVITALDKQGIACSTGSACTSGRIDPSHVIVALGVPYQKAGGAVRFSLGKKSSAQDISYVLRVLPKIVEKLRQK